MTIALTLVILLGLLCLLGMFLAFRRFLGYIKQIKEYREKTRLCKALTSEIVQALSSDKSVWPPPPLEQANIDKK